jgi:hypothetical protein
MKMSFKTVGVFLTGVVVGAAGALLANHFYTKNQEDWDDIPEPEGTEEPEENLNIIETDAGVVSGPDPEKPYFNGIPWEELNAVERREARHIQTTHGIKLSERHAPALYTNIFEEQDKQSKAIATEYDKILKDHFYNGPDTETKPKNKQRRGIEPGRKPKEDNMIEITSEQFIANYDQDVEQRTCTYYVNDQVLGGYNDSLDEMDPDEYGLTRFVDDLFYDPDKGAIYVTDLENGIDYEIVKSLGSFDEEWAELNPDPTAVK